MVSKEFVETVFEHVGIDAEDDAVEELQRLADELAADLVKHAAEHAAQDDREKITAEDIKYAARH